MKNTRNVFVAGAAGHLGQLVVTQLLDHGHRVTALIRDSAGKHADTTAWMRARGATIVEGDIHTPAQYEPALAGIDALVSTLQGGPEIIIDGQKQLADAALRAGVAHFIPSDFAIDYFGIPDGTHVFLDWRRAFANYLHQQPIAHTHVLNGAFMEVLLYPNMGLVDFVDHTLHYWGDGRQKMDFTTMVDTAKAVELAVADDRYRNQHLDIAGEQITYLEMLALLGELTGHPFTSVPLGSIAELEARIKARQEGGQDVMTFVFDQYNWAMASGKAKLPQPLTTAELGFTPTTLREFLGQAISQSV